MVKSIDNVESIVIRFDGTYIEGYAGIGFEIRARGKELIAGYEIAPWCENSMQAEAYAMFTALQEVEKFPNLKSIYVYGDSKGIIDSANKKTIVSDSYVQKLIEKSIDIHENYIGTFSHKPRESNLRAHELAGRSQRLLRKAENKEYAKSF